MVEEQQRQERTTLPPQYEKLHIPQNVVMVPADQWEQMQIQLGQQRIRQYYGMSPDQSPVSELHSPSSPVPALVAKI